MSSCNCNSQSIPTITTLPDCSNGEPCDETFKLGCVTYTGDELVELGITPGERLGDILQIIIQKLSGYTCSDNIPIVGVKSGAITYNSIEVQWTQQDGISYIVSYKKSTDSSYTDISVATANKYTITGLSASTKYYIQIKKNISGPTCPSATIAVTTLAS